jgi:CspA family cold shock protein
LLTAAGFDKTWSLCYPQRRCAARAAGSRAPQDLKKDNDVEEDVSMDDGEAAGTVKWFSRMKGWGFIQPDGGDRDVFVHYSDIEGDGFKNLEKGARVRFRIEDTPKGPKAVAVAEVV